MALVSNNIVKMDWNKDEFLTKKSKAMKGVELFIAAFRVYNRENDTPITITFNAGEAFLWVEDVEEDYHHTIPVADQIKWIQKNHKNGGYPDEYDSKYVAIADGNGWYDKSGNFQKELGISDEDAADIVARVNDLLPYTNAIDLQ